MPTSYLPSGEAMLLAWGQNASGHLSATPAVYGIDAPAATRFAFALGEFSDAYDVVQNPATRTPSAIILKNARKAEFIAVARATVRVVQASLVVTDVQRSDLRITIRKPDVPTPAPTFAPRLDVTNVGGRTFKLQASDPRTPDRRARPAGVKGMTVFYFVGEAPSESPDDWTFYESTSSMTSTVVLADSVAAGSSVYFCAFFYNLRAESGPACRGVQSFVQFGGSMKSTATVKKAA